MKSIIILLFTTLFLLNNNTYSQSIWTKTYQYNVEITCTFQYNESYVGFGYGTKLNYLRTNKNGDTLIQKVIIDTSYTGSFYPSSGAKTFDNNLIVAGISNPMGSNEFLRLYKLDSLGNTIWTHVYPDTSPNAPLCKLVPTSDSGFAIFGHDALQGYLIKVDKNGNQVFRKNYGYSYMYPRDAVLNNDGSITICGYQGLSQFTNFLLNVDPSGNIVWTRSVSAIQLFETMIKINSNYYVMGSRSNSPLTLFKFDQQGYLTAQLPTIQYGSMYSMAIDFQKNIICSGIISNADSVSLLKIDTLANVLFKTAIYCANSGESMSCFVDNDSNYVYAGRLDNLSFISKVYNSHSIVTNTSASKKNENLEIFPNPICNHLINIKSDRQILKLEIFNLNGNFMETLKSNNSENIFRFNSSLNGIYILKMYPENSNPIFKKIIIKNEE